MTYGGSRPKLATRGCSHGPAIGGMEAHEGRRFQTNPLVSPTARRAPRSTQAMALVDLPRHWVPRYNGLNQGFLPRSGRLKRVVGLVLILANNQGQWVRRWIDGPWATCQGGFKFQSI
jgi:hypothetical protein